MSNRKSPTQRRAEKNIIDAEITETQTGIVARVPIIPIEVGTNIWEKWPKETSKAYRAFLVYRDLGVDRSLRKVAMVLHNSYPGLPEEEKLSKLPRVIPVQIQKWSRQNAWTTRVAAWDNFIFQEEEKAWFERKRQLREVRWNASEKLFNIGMEALKGLDSGLVTPEDIVRILRLASDLGEKTKQEAVSVDTLREFLNSLPAQLRDTIMGFLKGPTNASNSQ